MRKRLLSITVVLTMLLSFIPTNIAFAVTGDNVVTEARHWIGTKYGHSDGSAGPGENNYVDCCGLTMQVYRKFGIELPWYTWSQDDCGTYVPYTQGNYSNLQPGDLLFMYNSGHVGIYAGNGKVIHASSNTYGKVVEVPIWSGGKDINTVRRIITGNEPHTHSWTYGNDASHPHREYRTCSCGEKQYTGKTKLVSTCQQCYPLGNVNLTRSFERVSRSATFYRNNVANANSYTLTLYKDGASYGTYNMSSTEKTVSSLASGTYTATLTARNTNTNQSKTANALSFTIVDTYDVAFDANGGTNAPSAQTKIKDEDLTLTSAKPTKAHYIFKGWAANRNETEPQYLAGGTYTKNTRITLYAVWEPETYTINFDANGGKGEVESTTITYGNTMKMPNTVVRDGYYLKGWSKTKGAITPDYKLGLDLMLDSNMTLYAVWGQSTWGGTVATEFAGGDGTEENPYQISNAAELAHLADKVNNQQSEPEYEYYILTDNIDLDYEEWIPIGLYGNENQYFKGSFDGNGYTISDLNITDINEGYVGLFGYAKEGEIKGLNITGNIENISSTLENAFIGTIVIYADKTDITDCSSQYVSISDITTNDNFFGIGGICGTTTGIIKNCEVCENYIGIQKCWKLAVGMIAGESTSTVSDCTVTASEELISTFDYGLIILAGGICGSSTGNIIRCNVNAGSLSNNLYGAGVRAGGIVGFFDGDTVEQCSVNFNSGLSKQVDTEQTNISISAQGHGGQSHVYAGGIIGYARPQSIYYDTEPSTIVNCRYNGQSIVAYNTYDGYYGNVVSGGIVGSADNVNRCIATVDGLIYGECNVNDFSKVGGIAGFIKNVNNTIAVVDKIKSKANSQWVNYSGDIVGDDGSAGSDYAKPSELEKLIYSNVYSNSGMTVEAENTYNSKLIKTHTIGTRRTPTLIKRASFLNQIFGPAYQSLAHLEEDPEAVWVIKDGEYPELYFTVLNDITVSDVEHGTISVDKMQAVDDEIVTVTAVPDEGYKLNKIYANGEEITGTTFTVAGDSDVYATFAEIPAEYRVSVAANANASAGLVNVDDTANTMSLQSVSLFSDNQALTATDGEEIKVNTQAAADYTVDAIYVNGEELAGDSFIVTDDSVVTMDAVSIRTDIKAQTYEAQNIHANGATLSGSVDGDENSSKYIRYWRVDIPDEIYTTEVETGSGEYSVEVTDLEPYVEYEYQMTEFGNVKSFTPEYVPVDDSDTEQVEPTPTYDYPVFEIKNQQLGTGSISLDIQNNADDTAAGTLIIAAYDSSDSLITIKTKAVANIPKDTSKSFDVDVPDAAYYKLFIWKDIKSMLPMADSVTVR